MKDCLERNIFDFGVTRDEQNQYWSRYDELLQVIQKEGGLKSRKEIDPYNFRESGGVVMHIGEDGSIYHGGTGNRRFAAALFAGVKCMPAQVGCVHIDALDHFQELRRKF